MQKTIKLLVFTCFICLARPGLCDSADRPTTAVLRFEPGGFSESIAAAKGEVEFSAEPKYAGTDLVRGSIQVGTRKMGYVLDQSTKTLYLDLNMNGNLTDDPAGAIKSTNAGDYYIDFNNIPLSIKTDGMAIPYKLSMIFNMGAAPVISMRSGWAGDIELAGRKYHLEIADDLSGRFAQGDALRLRLEGSWPSTLKLNDKQRIYLDNRLYEVKFSFVPAAKGADVLAEFKPAGAETGRLQIDGKFIHRLALTDRGAQTDAVYTTPTAEVEIPAGDWLISEVVLKSRNETYTFKDAVTDTVSVKPGETAKLAVGGPLRNAADIQRQGTRTYVFNFKVVDQAGRAYKNYSNTREKPRLEILKGGKQVIAASFEYG